MVGLVQSIWRNAAGLGLFAVITAGTIAMTQALTEERIEDQVRRAEASALFDIVPEHQHDNDLLDDTVALPPQPQLGIDENRSGWVARQDGQVLGMILPVVTAEGYSGDIRLLVGVRTDGDVLGVRVTSHQETPGLGDKIEVRKSSWIKTFEGRSLSDPDIENWAVRKNGGVFDQFTGATITPRAVVAAVRDTLVYFRTHRQQLLAAAAAQSATRATESSGQ